MTIFLPNAKLRNIMILSTYLPIKNNNNNNNNNPTSRVWGGWNVLISYHYLVEVERLCPKDLQFKCN